MENGRKVALVTGASGGIGQALAVRLAAAGYDMGVHYHSNRVGAEAVERQAEARGVRAAIFQADACEPAQMRHMVRACVASFGRIDVLVNNVGLTVLRPFLEVDDALYDRLLAANVKTPYFTAQEAALSMVSLGLRGCIVNITSVQQRVNFPEASVYGATKAALAKLTEHMAVELSPYGIRVNAVAPGYINTKEGPLSPRAAHIQARVPLQRLGRAEDVANLVAFIVSEESGYLQGANIAVDGGMPLPSAADNLYTPRVVTDKLG